MSETSATYLFVWSPKKWKWETLEQNIEQLKNTGSFTQMWSCVSHKKIGPGDRAFLVRVGSEPKGIFASGCVSSAPFLAKHWSGEDREVYRVDINFDVLLNPDEEPILTLDILSTGNLEKQPWTPQSSGILIKAELVDELEGVWFDFLTTHKIRQNPYAATQLEAKGTYTEGGANQVIQTRYERNPYARKACIKYYGYSCSVCDFNFEKEYGALGKDFIHVHHLIQISATGQREVDPVKDLRPVCPNCHAMLHRKIPALTLESLKEQLSLNS